MKYLLLTIITLLSSSCQKSSENDNTNRSDNGFVIFTKDEQGYSFAESKTLQFNDDWIQNIEDVKTVDIGWSDSGLATPNIDSSDQLVIDNRLSRLGKVDFESVNSAPKSGWDGAYDIDSKSDINTVFVLKKLNGDILKLKITEMTKSKRIVLQYAKLQN